MADLIERFPVGFVAGSNAGPAAEYGADQQAVLNANGFEAARQEITSWPGYAPTPLVALPGLAAAVGLGEVWYKDEGSRFGLGSFKAIGGAYAVCCLLRKELARCAGEPEVTTAALLSGKYREILSDITVCTATDGNHGRSVAWGAQTFGCRCVIYIHATVSEGRKAAMESLGAEVRRVSGNYDDSVHQTAADAAEHGWFVVSDTSYPGYTEIPRDVMHGYMVMVDEAVRQLPDGMAPTHVFVQGGVGGLAAAVAARLWLQDRNAPSRFVMVEPEDAACLFESAKAGEPVVVPGDLDTVMAGLAAGEVSLLAWRILEAVTDGFMTVPDRPAKTLMRMLAGGVAGDPPVVAGESAVAGLAGAIGGLMDTQVSEALRLGADSRILVFGTEGATDPEIYEQIVGRTPEAVREG